MRTTLAALLILGVARADDWPAFRGPNGDGLGAEKSAPAEWSATKNVKWKVPLPRPGDGSPIVSKGRVFVACAEDADGQRRSLYCFDRKDGKQLWVRTVEFGKTLPTHKDNLYCGTTPVADGERVVVWHASAGLHCYDFQGKELWKRDFGEFRHMWGYGSSPILHEGRVILHTGPGKRVFVTALDLKTGKTVWETDERLPGTHERDERGEYMGSWCTPIVHRGQLLCVMPLRVVAYAPDSGKVLWFCDGIRHKAGSLAYSSPVVAGDLVVAYGGYGGPGVGVKLGGSGDVSATHRAWRNESNPQSIGSGVVVDGWVYQPQAGRNTIDCIDPKTGKAKWMERNGAAFCGSISGAAGRLYVTDQQGTTVVFKPNPERFELVAKNPLGEACNATPAISDGDVIIRTFQHLWCLAETP
jgi:outer membrane protein assembly factor BamB